MKRNIEEVVWNIVDFLLVQSFGTEISIREAYDTVYAEEGYQWVQFDGKGWVSSKDGGKTYLIEDMDLFDVLAAVKKELKQEGRILDFSQWEDQCVGVPYNLEFVLREKKKRTVYCPKCGSDKVAPIVYGLPTYATMQRAEQGEFFLGGCMVCDGQSDYKCKTCEYDWSHEQLPSTVIKKVRYTIRTQGLETIENSRKWVYEVFPDGKCKCYTYHGREKNADFIEEEVVSENKIKTLYRELQKLIKMQYESVERICDGCNYTLQITYKDNRRKIVRENIDMDSLMHRYPYEQKDVQEIYDLIVETVVGKGGSMTISGQQYPRELVKSRFLKLNMSHVEYVMECLRKNTTKIYNIKAYLLAALFNVGATMSNYYRAEVNHDMPQFAS